MKKFHGCIIAHERVSTGAQILAKKIHEQFYNCDICEINTCKIQALYYGILASEAIVTHCSYNCGVDYGCHNQLHTVVATVSHFS